MLCDINHKIPSKSKIEKSNQNKINRNKKIAQLSPLLYPNSFLLEDQIINHQLLTQILYMQATIYLLRCCRLLLAGPLVLCIAVSGCHLDNKMDSSKMNSSNNQLLIGVNNILE